MRPALTFSTRRAKSSTCILKQCQSYLTTNTPFTTTTHKKVPQLPPLWFLVTRSSSSQALLKEEAQSSSENLYSKFHPRTMNKNVNLDSLLAFLSKSSLSPKNKFKSLRTALYNTTQYDSRKAWLIYETMVRYQVDKYLKLNHYGFLLCILKYGDSIQHMLTVIENMKKLNPREDIDYHISQVLFAMGRQGLVEEACHLIGSSKDFKPSANHYHSLAIALKNNKPNNNSKSIESVTKILLDGMEQHQTVLHNTTLSTMISVLSSSQQKDLTLQFLKAMDKANSSCSTTSTTHSVKNNSHPYNVYIYTSLIAGFARQGDSESAKRIFDEMRKHKVEPNQVTFSALMEAYGKAGDFNSAIRLLTDHQKRYRKVNNAMVTSLLVNAIRQNNLIVAENAVKFITKKKVKVKDMDSTLLTALIWVKTKLCVDEARKDFDLLYKEDKNLVNSIMVNHLITGYGLKGDKESVIQLYNLNEKNGNMSPAEEKRSKHHLANALFHCRDVPAAMGVFASMRYQNVPDDVTLAMVIQGLIMNNENNLAWRLFKTLQSDGIEPNLHAYTTILKAIGHREVDLKKKQGNSGLSPEMVAAAGIRLPTLDYLHSAVPSTTEALNLFRRLTGFQQPNVYTYTTLISCFAKHNISRAISIFDHMCAKGVQPSVETYTAILQGCSIFRNSQMALSVFNHMCENRVEPNSVTWRYLLKSLLRSRVDKKQIDKIAQMAKKSLDKKVE
ncbi:unnamed protein product [Mucor hiemalis]